MTFSIVLILTVYLMLRLAGTDVAYRKETQN